VIRFEEERPPVSAEELAAAEQRLAEMGMRIPPSYRAFLAERDWARPVECVFSFRGADREGRSLVESFRGVAPVQRPAMNLLDVAEDMPGGVLPIAKDPMGNEVCLDGRDGRDGPVLFWDHEEASEDPEDESNLYFVAADLQSFLDGLTEPPPLPDDLPRGRELAPGRAPFDWRRLLGRRR